RESLHHLFVQYRQYGYWKVRVIQKHRMPASLRHLIPAGFVFTLTLLPGLSLFWPTAFWIWLSLVCVYVAVTVSLSVLMACPSDWDLLPLFLTIFWIFHFAYGWGFLRGFADFVVLRRKGR